MNKSRFVKQIYEAVYLHFQRWCLYWLLGLFIILFLGLLFLGISLIRTSLFKVSTLRGRLNLNSDSTPLSEEGRRVVFSTRSRRSVKKLILPFARVRSLNIVLYLPAFYGDVMGIGYHESSNNKAFSLEPIGYCLRNDNTVKTDVKLDSNAPLPTYYIMESRGEYEAATTVADIALQEGAPVLSPVDGEVTKVKPLIIYGAYDDIQLEIMPDGHPNLRIAFLHIDQLKVKVGDRVKLGKTVLGVPRDLRNSFRSQIEDYMEASYPHVHLQLNRYVPEVEQ